MRDSLWHYSRPIGSGLIALSVGVLFLTFQDPYNDRIWVPGLVPVFGVPFAVTFIAAQLWMLAVMKSQRGVALAAFFMVVGAALMILRNAGWFWPLLLDPSMGLTLPRQVVCAAACTGGAAVGIGLASGWLSRAD